MPVPRPGLLLSATRDDATLCFTAPSLHTLPTVISRTAWLLIVHPLRAKGILPTLVGLGGGGEGGSGGTLYGQPDSPNLSGCSHYRSSTPGLNYRGSPKAPSPSPRLCPDPGDEGWRRCWTEEAAAALHERLAAVVCLGRGAERGGLVRPGRGAGG